MKKIILLLGCLISIGTSAINYAATGVTLSATKELVNPTIPLNCPGDIFLLSQVDVDSFVGNYGCSVITGSLTISGNDITNLNGLSQLTSIGGGLYIQYVPNLTNYSGLNNLATIAGGFVITGDTTSVIVGFTGLISIGGGIIGGGINITDTIGLISISAFNNLTAIDNLIFNNNLNLIAINGFSSLQSIDHFTITVNPVLQQLPNISLATTIGSLYINENPLLLNLNGLNSVTTINFISLGTNNSLNSIAALSNITSVNNLSINYCNSLTSLTGIENILPSSLNAVSFYNNPQLSVCNLPNICSFIDNTSPLNVYINANAPGCNSAAQVLVACGILETCSGNIFLFSQADVDNFTLNYGCSTITGTLYISGSDITNLNGLSQLTSVVGNLSIINNPILPNLNGLNGLTTINGTLELTSNNSLNSIATLSNLTLLSVLWITDCNSLVSLSGLQNVNHNSLNQVNIYNNLQLSVCNMPSICNFVSLHGGNISSNAAGCNSTSQVLLACGISLNCQNSITLSSQAEVDNFVLNYGCSVISAGLSISGNDITNLNGLSQLTSVVSLDISGNPLLVNLTGLNNLQNAKYLNIISNNTLSNINALSGLQLATFIFIKSNSSLTSISGLDNISPHTIYNLHISGSFNLSTCAIASICDKIALDGTSFLNVAYNGSNCNSAQEIANICSPDINLKLFIEGFYLNGETMQSVVLNQTGYSPLDVENITVELHDATTFELITSSTAVLKTNGTAVCRFLTDPPTGQFYIVIKSRNAIQTWSAIPQSLNPLIPLVYDFSTAASQAFGDNMVEIEPNVWAFYSGDINQDEVVDASDAPDLFDHVENSVFGNTVTDLNGDGSVDNTDIPFFLDNSDSSIYTIKPQN